MATYKEEVPAKHAAIIQNISTAVKVKSRIIHAVVEKLCRRWGAAVMVKSIMILKIVAVVQFMTPQKIAAKAVKSYESDMWPQRRSALRACTDARTPTR